ncbi:hypothetical protein GDO78_004480 [Eleutherodactylus coqui]|uniref:RING-type E3 ubiquitin transferase n=2 Tax=Eleutherodactylus coqui TaxID=57060 RepID=A0A8J6ESV0_ELECQ|nr:hypothetical protein GDO78_004480 [Eleutherodactylus coqui]KAG9474195.1 hypothetical protein GDO78_004480 [Eleutherodactylus coqui]KAG9474196.1 hypothetical protein GDO78_004480 [Eleutherodactylus coqui]
MERKRLRVDGIPTDIPAGRAKDKLTIHFLRSRNGGGEVESIDVIQGPPAYAIVTFEDDKVVESVLRIKDHTLQINDKIYNLVVSEDSGKMELEEVFQKLSLTINCKKIPESCRSLLENFTHKDVKYDFDEKSLMCTISGPYTEIQAVAQEILKKLEIKCTNLKQIPSDARKKTKSDRFTYQSDSQGVPQVLDQRSTPLYASPAEARYSLKTESLEQVEEPFVWDSDIFKYIQKFHTLEYQEILDKYHVHAVDESSDGITTVYLQTVTGGKNHLADLSYARSRLLGLYQGLELLLRKEQINKRDLYGDQDFHKMMLRDLQKLYPMLLCHDDDRYLYLIGNGVDVAQGKQYISELQMKFDRSSSYPDTRFKASGAGTISEGAPHSLSPTYKHESKVGSRIAASFTAPATHTSYSTKNQIDERYLASSDSPNRQLLDRSRDPPNDKTSPGSAISSDLQKNEDFGLSQTDEKSESKTMPSLKRRDVFPALKTGREEIRHNRTTSKATGPLKPVRFTKASSELPYSSLVDMNSPSMEFKVPEGKLRRSNSLSRVYSKENASSEQQSDTLIFKDEVVVTDWLWQYTKQAHKSDIDSWCSEGVLMEEEKQKGKVTLKLKATNKSVLTLTKERIQLLCWKEDVSITSSCFYYSTLGVQGPDDIALAEWYDVFHKCSKKLYIKLEEDKLVLLYPKEIQSRIIEEYSQNIERKMKSSKEDLMQDDHQSSSHLKDKFEFSGHDMAESYLTESKHKHNVEDQFISKRYLGSFHLGGEDLNEAPNFRGGKDLADQSYSLKDPFQGLAHEHKAFFDNPVPALLDENSIHPKELQDFLEDAKNNSTSEKTQTDFYTSRKHLDNLMTEVKPYNQSPYTSELLTQGITFSPLNVLHQTDSEAHYGDQGISTDGHKSSYQSSSSQLRVPAIGQESEVIDSICDQCKNNGKTVQASSGQNMCVKCYTTFLTSAINDTTKDKGTIKVSMTHTSMSLSLPGYERATTLKIIYEVPDGVQGAGDPQPGCPYKGGRFEAYLPDTPEGRRFLVLLQKALDEGLIFHIQTFETGEKVTWYKIPHKTSPDGGKQKNGYPDLKYMKSTIAVLKENGIE